MIRIAGINIDSRKHVEIALTSIYGIGRVKAQTLCENVNIDYRKPLNSLSHEELELIRQQVKACTVEGDLKRIVFINIKRLIDIGSYRGRRHKYNLPVRGQRTKTNAKTSKQRKRLSTR